MSDHQPSQPDKRLTPGRKTLCLTIGDPTGVGPEITAKFLVRWANGEFGSISGSAAEYAANLSVYGDIVQLRQSAEKLGIQLPKGNRTNDQEMASSAWLRYVDLGNHSEILPGQIAYESIRAAVSAIKAGEADALVTGPISKENLKQADVPFEGHTEMLQALARQEYGGNYQSDMLFLYKKFRMLLLTRHVPLQLVCSTLTIAGVTQSLDSLCRFLTDTAGLASPRICMLGVNPHAGEVTRFQPDKRFEDVGFADIGKEEKNILTPAISEMTQRYPVTIPSPVAADAAFRGFDCTKPPADAYVAAYHDQGLIPFKMAAGLEAVNVTIGLPFLRTSVSHGTAPDIAGQGLATPISMIAAYRAALDLLKTMKRS